MNIIYACGTVHCRKTRIPCGNQLVICGQYAVRGKLVHSSIFCLFVAGVHSKVMKNLVSKGSSEHKFCVTFIASQGTKFIFSPHILPQSFR
jgi:hypothetical protein